MNAARSRGVVIRREAFGRSFSKGGGMCRLHGALTIVLDAEASDVDQIFVIAEALASEHLHDLIPVEASTDARALLQRALAGKPAPVKPLARPLARARSRV